MLSVVLFKKLFLDYWVASLRLGARLEAQGYIIYIN